ncbi:SDR family oxidoreductase, partial [Acinetobacter baumannii]
AAQGIGLACAQRLHEEGARVVLSDINGDKVAEAAATLANGGDTTLAVTCDGASQAAVKALVAAAIERFGTVDIMVNNAATTVASEP